MSKRPSVQRRTSERTPRRRPSIHAPKKKFNLAASLHGSLTALGSSVNQAKSSFANVRKTKPNPTPLSEDAGVRERALHVIDSLPVSRRGFLAGAGAVTGLVIVGGTASLITNKKGQTQEDPSVLHVAQDKVFTRKDCKDLDPKSFVQLERTVELPSGSLIFSNSNEIAACLIPHEDPTRLMKLAALDLRSGQLTSLLDSSLGHAEGFEIYDARISSQGLIWVEAHTASEEWKLYARPLTGGQPFLLDQGDHEREIPSIGIVGDRAFWQSLAAASLKKKSTENYLKRHLVGSQDIETLVTSTKRFACPLYADTQGIVVCPRAAESSSYQLSYFDAQSAQLVDSLRLPAGMSPQDVGYGHFGFSFSFESIYNFGEGISNLGTYVPAQSHQPEQYQDLEWFRFDASPYAPIAWCGPLLLVKGRFAISAVNLAERGIFALESENSTDTWGDYLASTGQLNRIVSYCSVPVGSKKSERKVKLRIWSSTAQSAPQTAPDADSTSSTSEEESE